jgi:hypothetical protein
MTRSQSGNICPYISGIPSDESIEKEPQQWLKQLLSGIANAVPYVGSRNISL